MTKDHNALFLEQIAESKRNINNWPRWMIDGTSVVVATLPNAIDRQRTSADLSDQQEVETKQLK